MMDNQKTFFPVDDRLRAVSDAAEHEAAGVFSAIDETAAYNQEKVLAAFIRHRVDEACFAATTGYGYGDKGRETLDKILADVMGAEDALIRHSILSGTHAITIALFAMLRPGDTMLAATGAPYDTLEQVIGAKVPCAGSLAEFGVRYREVPLGDRQRPDHRAIAAALREDSSIRLVHIQRSRGYCTRPSLTIDEIRGIVQTVRAVRPDVTIFVDNCYGEFVERQEPTCLLYTSPSPRDTT